MIDSIAIREDSDRLAPGPGTRRFEGAAVVDRRATVRRARMRVALQRCVIGDKLSPERLLFILKEIPVMNATSQWIGVDTADGRFEGYLALPPAGRGPGVLIVQEIFGVTDHIRSVAEQYALAGYVALAPDIFWRSEPRVELSYDGTGREKGFALLKATDVGKAVADLDAAARVLKARPETVGKTAAVGFCWGGSLAYRMAVQGSVDAAVAYYGGGIQNQLDAADRIHVPMLFHFGAEDGSIPLDAVDTIKQRFAGRHNAELYVYEGAGHAFNRPQGTTFNQRASALALGRTMTFLASYL